MDVQNQSVGEFRPVDYVKHPAGAVRDFDENHVTTSVTVDLMSYLLCQVLTNSLRAVRAIDARAHMLTPNDNTRAWRTNRRKKQRFDATRCE
jgi:hypothetical protein